MPSVNDLTAAVFAAFPARRAADLVARLATMDRLQASRGIERAADLVAEHAEAAGLHAVEVRRIPVDGSARWWSFRSPAPWTPRRAALDLLTPAGAERVVAFPELACSLATYSAPASLAEAPLLDGAGLPLDRPPPWPGLRGAVVLLAGARRAAPPPLRLLADGLAASGAAGLVTDLTAPDVPEAGAAAGRVELARGSQLFGFSVPPRRAADLLAAARRGARVRVEVEVERAGTMPLVHGLLPGAPGAPELLLQAHLCHPRPAANDNGSGVAALVGVAEAVTALGDRLGRPLRGARLLWAPEFAGTAAFLHDLVGQGVVPAPRLALNLDMVGEDQAQCGGPLVVESPPGHLPSVLPALAEAALAALPAPLRSYSGAVPLRDWGWAAVPFTGASDHAVLADRSVGCPAVCLGHWPDRFRHSSLDTPERVDPEELRRAGAVAGALAQFFRCAGPRDLPELQGTVARWAAGRMLAIAGHAARGGPAGVPPGDPGGGRGPGAAGAGPGTVDPFSPAYLGRFLAHTAASALAALREASLLLGGDGSVPSGIRAWLDGQAAALAALAGAAMAGTAAPGDGAPGDDPTGLAPERGVRGEPGVRLRRAWHGPFNLQGLEEAASPADRDWLVTELHRRGGAYAQMLALALAIDGASTLAAVAEQAAYSTWLPVELGFARRYAQVLIDSRWATAAP